MYIFICIYIIIIDINIIIYRNITSYCVNIIYYIIVAIYLCSCITSGISYILCNMQSSRHNYAYYITLATRPPL